MRLAYVGKNMKKSAERRGLNPIENSSATVVVDVANVMGARADGWWRDRAGAALRLCHEVTALASRYAAAPEMRPVAAWVLVLEGRARGAAERWRDATAGAAEAAAPVRVVSAPASGDDAIVAVVRDVAASGEKSLVVTADRELRRRCAALGAEVAGPGWLLRLL